MDTEPAESELSSLCRVPHPVNQTAVISQGAGGAGGTTGDIYLEVREPGDTALPN